MTKESFCGAFTEDYQASVRERVSVRFPGKPSLINEVCALSDDGVDLLIDFVGTPTDSAAGMEQATYARQLIEGDLGVSLRFVEMMPRQRYNSETGKREFTAVSAWYRLD